MAEFYPPAIVDKRQAEIDAAQQQQKSELDQLLMAVYQQGTTDARQQMQQQPQRGQPVPQQPVRYTKDSREFPSFFLKQEMDRKSGKSYDSPLGVTQYLFGGDTPVPGYSKRSRSAVEELFGDQLR